MYGFPLGPNIGQLRMSGLFGTRLNVKRRSDSDEELRTGKAPNTDGAYETGVVLGFIDMGFSGLYQPACAYGLLLYMLKDIKSRGGGEECVYECVFGTLLASLYEVNSDLTES